MGNNPYAVDPDRAHPKDVPGWIGTRSPELDAQEERIWTLYKARVAKRAKRQSSAALRAFWSVWGKDEVSP